MLLLRFCSDRVSWVLGAVLAILPLLVTSAAAQERFHAEQLIDSTASDPYAVETADINGDEDPDVLAAYRGANLIAWYENSGQGDFGPRHLISRAVSEPMAIDVADVDGDGDPDVASVSIGKDKVAYYKNEDGSFGDQQVLEETLSRPRDLQFADLNDDGRPDLVVVWQGSNRVAWFENLGGTFGSRQTIAKGVRSARSVDIADLDNDQDLDVLSAATVDSSISWYENTESGFGGRRMISREVPMAQDVHATDLDGDGDKDVLAIDQDEDRILWFENEAKGFGSPRLLTAEVDRPAAVTSGDIDGDGDPDVLSASGQDGKIAWYEQTESGFAGQNVINSRAVGARGINVGDIDGDGDVDVLSASTHKDKISWYPNAPFSETENPPNWGPATVEEPLPARYYASSVWDPVNQRMLIYGGDYKVDHSDDLYAYDPEAGTFEHVATGPYPVYMSTAVWDSTEQRMLIFGGNDGGEGRSMRNDILSYDIQTGTFATLDPSGEKPHVREQSSVVFAPGRGEMYAFGGMIQNKDDNVNDLWVYQVAENAWTELHPEGASPEVRRGHGAVWDAQAQEMLVYGGWDNEHPFREDLWAYRPDENRWVEKTTGGEPHKRYRQATVWNPEERRMYVFGGCCGLGKYRDIWSYDAQTGTWTEEAPLGPIPPGHDRVNDMAVWDPIHEAVIVYGGIGACQAQNDLWAYVPDKRRWKKLSQGGDEDPLRRFQHATATLNGKVYVFGGCDGTRQLGDLLEIDPDAETVRKLHPPGPVPGPRSYHKMVAAPELGKLFVFGGKGGPNSSYKDLWSYDPDVNRWTKHEPEGTRPGKRRRFGLAWDPSQDRLLLFGGIDTATEGERQEAFLNDLWEYDPSSNSWTELPASESETGPRRRKDHMMVWDHRRDQLLVYSGWMQWDDGSKDTLNGVWAYQPSSQGWTQLADRFGAPPHRAAMDAIWNPVTSKMMVYGGWRLPPYVGPERGEDDLWAFDPSSGSWQQVAQDTPPPNRMYHGLAWNGATDQPLLVAGYGGSQGRYLSDVWSYDPQAERWSELPLQLTTTATGEVSKTRTLPKKIALGQSYPNPFNPSTRITYKLPEAAQVRLTVYDILGRRVKVLVNGRRAAGRHAIPFQAEDLPSGLYFYRLTVPNRFSDVKSMVLAK